MNPFKKVHWIDNFPKGYPWYNKIKANLIYFFGGIIIYPRNNFLSKEDILQTKKVLKKGDVLLLGNLEESSVLFIGSPLTHTGIYAGGREVVWGVGDGIKIASLYKVFTDYDTLVILRLPKRVKKRRRFIRKAVRFAKDQVNKPFDFDFAKNNKKSFFCSQLVNEAYRCSGYNTGLISTRSCFIKKDDKIHKILHPHDFLTGKFKIVFVSHNLKIKNKKPILIEKG